MRQMMAQVLCPGFQAQHGCLYGLTVEDPKAGCGRSVGQTAGVFISFLQLWTTHISLSKMTALSRRKGLLKLPPSSAWMRKASWTCWLPVASLCS